jgi:hypothetical protein
MSTTRMIEMTRDMTLDECFVEAGCQVGDELEIVGNRKYVLKGGRPRVTYLRLTRCRVDAGDGAFYVGHANLNTRVDIESCIVEGRGPETAKNDVFMGVTLNCVDGCIWGKTLNGPVNALGVYQSVIANIRSDALSGVLNATDVRVEKITGGGGSHPDMHQLYLPNLEKPIVISLGSVRGWEVNGQGLHWTVTNDKEVSGRMINVHIPWRRKDEVWQSRITVPLGDFTFSGCTFGQPLRFAPSRMGAINFVDCQFNALIAETPEEIEILNKCTFVRCTIHTPKGTHGTHVPESCVVIS